ncbi:MAG: thioredoxin domain-containing protein [Saprospirales bacterium]|nr:thioredoxin domain-containing protein [Saprospirales bacterium]
MNQLQNETSPYLLQHKNNPVDWYPFGKEALKIALHENKLVLVSVGYAACHWCHVMEHESFEDEKVAKVMNEHFISIKVDREERPDIDQIYMNCAMITTGHGGWPLNVLCLPDGKPFFAGTYFPKDKWINALIYFADIYKKEPQKIIDQATRITQGLQEIEMISLNQNERKIDKRYLEIIWENWKDKLDYDFGGRKGAPKFMMPNTLEFLFRLQHHIDDNSVATYLKTTLKKMAFGGLYDVIGGGFARYSVDAFWKVPHFEKMLYDNAQLLTIYAHGYQLTKRPMYKSVIEKTIGWIDREMTDKKGGIYASLDADSEGVEGKFYCWYYDELKEILGTDFDFIKDLYNIEKEGNFEHGMNVLFRTNDHEYFMEKYGITNEIFQEKLNTIHQLLFEKRKAKIRPNLDDKILTEWNALFIEGLVDCYKAIGDESYLNKAISITEFILQHCKQDDYRLNRNYKNGISNINAFLPDYAYFMDSLMALYSITMNEQYLNEALNFMKYAIAHFYDKTSGMFYFTSDIDEKLVARIMESSDNVIPSSNSAMAKNLLLLSKFFDMPEYEKMASTMLNNVLDDVLKNPPFYSNWAILLDMNLYHQTELIIIGKDAKQLLQQISRNYLPNVLIAASETRSELPLFKDRFVKEKTLIYVCKNKACLLPVESVEEAMKLIK